VTYHIVELSATLRQRQQLRLQAWSHCVHWHDQLPAAIQGVVVGNEVLDALPVKVLSRINGQWHERGVVLNADGTAWQWLDVPTTLRPPIEIKGQHDYVTEIHPQARGLMNTLAQTVQQGAVFWMDYGFPELEYYHPQRSMGTLVCHHLHQVDVDPLTLVGQKDITAHVNFTDVAMAAQDAGWQVLGYTSQGRFLINCGLLGLLESADLPARSNAARLVNEHEMGELFKVMAMAPASCATGWVPCGFQVGDRTHTL
jgi:SAM-dependent MidA family methyltransferase